VSKPAPAPARDERIDVNFTERNMEEESKGIRSGG
jgi:hypothetical protein